MFFPIRPRVPARGFFVHVRDASGLERPVQLPVLPDQEILGAAVEADRWKCVAVPQQGGEHRPIFFGIAPSFEARAEQLPELFLVRRR